MVILNCVPADYQAEKAFWNATFQLDPEPREWITARIDFSDGCLERIPWEEQPAYAAALATVIERGFEKHEEWTKGLDWQTLFNAAMMIRIKAGGEAIIGEPLDWKPAEARYGTSWHAVDKSETEWDLYPDRLENPHWEIIVARWDSADWGHDNLEEAKLIAEHIGSWPKPKWAK